MQEEFDAYYTWLGISKKDQPPNHYRLLGVDIFESNDDAIDNAAEQRLSHLRRFSTGKHATQSQQLLNDVSRARLCLLNVEKRKAYDEALKATTGSSVESASKHQGGDGPATAHGDLPGPVPMKLDRVLEQTIPPPRRQPGPKPRPPKRREIPPIAPAVHVVDALIVEDEPVVADAIDDVIEVDEVVYYDEPPAVVKEIDDFIPVRPRRRR